ncbi:lactonase family protein [Streptomyces sp. LE64]|uniref:lactonase family protein n=1 Tax=Streptomyces sp. LE64 TaxID=3448653 RepID=UPI004041DB8E
MATGRGHAGRAYVGSFTAAGGPGVVSASVDPVTGALHLLGATDTVADPSYLALSSDGAVLYAVSETSPGAVTALDVTADRPRPIGGPVLVGGDGPTHLALYRNHLLTANYGSGSVSAVPLRSEGALAQEPSGVLVHEGTGPHPQRQQAPHAHQVLPAPGGRWAVSVDLGTDSVRVFDLAGSGEPRVHREVALRPGSGPRHLVFHPGGTHAYVVNELAPTLTVCRWDGGEGVLRPLTEVALLPEAPEGDAYPSAVTVDPDGRFVWVAVRGTDVLSVLAVEEEGAGLRRLATVPCGGRWPRDLTVDPTGRRLYAANERSGDVTWFDVDPLTGLPTRAGSVPVPAASCVVLR